MKTNPITPPRELVKKIFGDALRGSDGQHDYELRLIHAAYAAGADHELKACCDLLLQEGAWPWPEEVARLRAARRPKPPSLKEQAQVELDRLVALISTEGALAMAEPIRRALEALDD